MGKLVKKGQTFAVALRPSGAQPLDDRSVVERLADLYLQETFTVNGNLAVYNGMIVSVQDVQQLYMLIDEENITSESSWVPVGKEAKIQNIKINNETATISSDGTAEISLDSQDITLGVDIANSSYQSNSTISSVLQNIHERIKAAASGGVQTISGDSSVVIGGNETDKTISINVEESTEENIKKGHIEIVKGNEGIYAQMYYICDDDELESNN